MNVFLCCFTHWPLTLRWGQKGAKRCLPRWLRAAAAQVRDLVGSFHFIRQPGWPLLRSACCILACIGQLSCRPEDGTGSAVVTSGPRLPMLQLGRVEEEFKSSSAPRRLLVSPAQACLHLASFGLLCCFLGFFPRLLSALRKIPSRKFVATK